MPAGKSKSNRNTRGHTWKKGTVLDEFPTFTDFAYKIPHIYTVLDTNKNVYNKQSVCVCSVMYVELFATPWTVAHHAPLSMAFSRQEYWSRLPFPPPGNLPNPGIEPMSPAWQVDSLPLSHLGSP